MLLRKYLEDFTKADLLDLARSFEFRKCSALRKAELIDKIVNDFCAEEMMRNRLACLTKEQMELFRKACIKPVDISINEVMNGVKLCRYYLGYFEDPTDRFCVFEDVAAAFGRIDDEEFEAEQNRKGWMIKCLLFFGNYYGIAPMEIIYEMYRQKVKCSIDEMIDMLWGMPVDIIESCIFSMDMLGMQDWPKEDPIYSEKGLLVHIPLLEDKEFDCLLRQQMDKSFYIPSVQQIEEIYRIGYESSSQAYKKLEFFLMKKLGLPYEQAVAWCLQIWANSYEGESPAEVVNTMSEAGIVFDSEKMLDEFMKLLISAHNNTRMKENRGHKPGELAKREFSGGMPTIVPGSSNAAAMLKEAAPQLQAMGIPVDLDGNADIIQTTMFPGDLNGETVKIEKKVYPNDPCPCGSGKKYKKCCGKK